MDPPANLPETSITVEKPEVVVISDDLPLKLPRVMRSLKSSSSNILREKNSDHVDDSISTREVEGEHSRTHVALAQETDEKENRAL